jgi:hypothetical protein
MKKYIDVDTILQAIKDTRAEITIKMARYTKDGQVYKMLDVADVVLGMLTRNIEANVKCAKKGQKIKI